MEEAAINKPYLKRIPASCTWSDLTVGQRVTTQLKDIAANTQPNKGVIALFAGPSGTGKTMAAKIIANELKKDLYRVDLGPLVSKYIGETEKSLNGLFEQSQDLNAILLFDEADELFGKRTKVNEAHDRYANLDTSHLLQRIENYSGLVILTSNLRTAFDDAFIQRMSWVIDFPKPRSKERLPIWRRLLLWFRVDK